MKLNEFNSLVDLFFYQVEKENSQKSFLEWLNPRNKKKFTWGETSENVYKLAHALKKNITNGDRCLLVSENRPEWLIADLAIMLANGITVPAYTTYTEKDYEYIIEDCNPSLIFVSDLIQYEKIRNIIPKKDFIKKVIIFDPIKNLDKNFNLEINEIFNSNEVVNKDIPSLKITRKDPACIIYTSGTQGNPKGVVLSHGGILNNCEGSCELLKPIISKDTK